MTPVSCRFDKLTARPCGHNAPKRTIFHDVPMVHPASAWPRVRLLHGRGRKDRPWSLLKRRTKGKWWSRNSKADSAEPEHSAARQGATGVSRGVAHVTPCSSATSDIKNPWRDIARHFFKIRPAAPAIFTITPYP